MKKTSGESVIRKLSRMPWTIHIIPIFGIIFLIFWIDNTNPWNLVGRLLAILYIYLLALVEFSRSSRQPSRSSLLKKQIVMAIVVMVEIVDSVSRWFLIPASDFQELLSFMTILSVACIVLLISELWLSWP